MSWSRWPLCSRVLANLCDGTAISGVLIDRRGPLLVLADAQLNQPGQAPQPMDGHIYIERAQVSFIQAIPAKGG